MRKFLIPAFIVMLLASMFVFSACASTDNPTGKVYYSVAASSVTFWRFDENGSVYVATSDGTTYTYFQETYYFKVNSKDITLTRPFSSSEDSISIKSGSFSFGTRDFTFLKDYSNNFDILEEAKLLLNK